MADDSGLKNGAVTEQAPTLEQRESPRSFNDIIKNSFSSS